MREGSGAAAPRALTHEHAAASDAFLVGRTTFEEMRGFWPTQTDDSTTRDLRLLEHRSFAGGVALLRYGF